MGASGVARVGAHVARRRAEAAQARDEIMIEIDLGVGQAVARMWTCDLSYDYVKINAEYTT